MKINSINDDILLIDDFLPDSEMEQVKEEIKKLVDDGKLVKSSGQEHTGFPNTSYDRSYPYEDNPNSPIIKIIEKYLFSPDFISEIEKFNSYPMVSLGKTDFNEVQITAYGDKYRYDWHRDNGFYRTLSYVLPVNFIENSFTGGETRIIHNKKTLSIKPIHNRLLLFSSHLLHDVKELKINDEFKENKLAKRFVVNGHIGYNCFTGMENKQ